MSTLDRDDLYDDIYNLQVHLREGEDEARNFTGGFDAADTSAFFRISLAVLLRVGFLFVQLGSVPVSNVNFIILQNIVDFFTVTLVYCLAGYVIAFNGDISGIIGGGVWIGDYGANMNEAIVGWGAAVTASAICTSGVVGRMNTIAYLITAILIAGLVQPLLMHWAWTPYGWMANGSLAGQKVYFRDFAGAATVHLVGGMSGFLGCMVLGRRLLRLGDIDDSSLSVDSPGNVTAGYFLIFLGLQGLGVPAPGYPTAGTSRGLLYILVNNILAASSSSLFVIALHFALSREAFNYWTVMRCVQGAISGVTTIAAGVDLYSPLIVIGISCCSGGVFYLVSRRVYRSALEDYCNVVAIHVACVLFGSFLAPWCGRPTGGSIEVRAMIFDMAWQVICILAVIVLVVLIMGPLFIIMDLCGILRNPSEQENHLRAEIAANRGPPRTYMQRLFFPDSNSIYLQPGGSNKSDQAAPMMSPRSLRYQQQIARIEHDNGKEYDNNNLSEAPAEQNPNPVLVTEDPAGTKFRKGRQIFTLLASSDSQVPEDARGGGESSINKGDPGMINNLLQKRGCINLDERFCHIKMNQLDASKRKFFQSHWLNQSCITVHNFRPRKQFCTNLQRTSKMTSLQLDNSNSKQVIEDDVSSSDESTMIEIPTNCKFSFESHDMRATT